MNYFKLLFIFSLNILVKMDDDDNDVIHYLYGDNDNDDDEIEIYEIPYENNDNYLEKYYYGSITNSY